MRILARLVLTAAVGAAGASALAQPQWTQLSPTAAPSSRQDHNMAPFTGNTIVLFGGSLSKNTSPLNDTWSWDGNTWTQLFPATAPTGVTGHAMAFDPARGRIVMFGGSTVPAGQVNYINETWEWDGSDWTKMTPATSPPARDWSSMTFDPTLGKVLLFGGRDSNNKPAGSYVPYADTWTWDGVDWVELFPATVPNVRHGHQLAFDQGLNKVVMTGGQRPGTTYDETWVWDSGVMNWVQLAPAATPGIRVFHAMEYDPARGVLVLHGGKNTSNNTIYTDTWEFDGSTWTQVDPAGPAYGWFPIRYDAVNQELLVQGGSPDQGHASSDGNTWTFGAGIWTDLGNDLAGSLGSPVLSAQGALSAGELVALTLSNAAVGSTSGLFIGASNASLPFFGGTLVPSPNVLVIVPTGPTGGYTLPGVYPAGVPAGFPLFFQVWVLDPTGPQGHTASNALTATTE
ncbi:MAG: kelch repeat-containing protein [Planctomycetota bacterium JB042]